MKSTLRFHFWIAAFVAVCITVTLTTPSVADPIDLTGAPTFMSSVEADGLGNTDFLWDGDRSTRIATGNNVDDPPGGDGNDNEWFYVDLGQPYILEEIRIDWEAAFGQDYDILVSDVDPGGVTNPSDSIWSLGATVRGFDQDGTVPPNHGGDVDNILNFRDGTIDLATHIQVEGVDEPSGGTVVDATGQYVMMHGQVRGSEWGFSVWEMEIDGRPVPEPSSLAMMAIGFFGLLGYTVRYAKNAS